MLSTRTSIRTSTRLCVAEKKKKRIVHKVSSETILSPFLAVLQHEIVFEDQTLALLMAAGDKSVQADATEEVATGYALHAKMKRRYIYIYKRNTNQC